MSLTKIEPDVIIGDDPRLVLVCDHAANHVPAELDLGVSDEDMQDHIAWDIGAAALTRMIARLMGISAVLAPVSRLVIDCNRDPGHPTLIPPSSDGVDVPGNQNLSAGHIQARLNAYYHPFHHAVDQVVRDAMAKTPSPILIAVHSFTPHMEGEDRPWDVGYLWNTDGRLAQALIGLMKRDLGVTIGDNEPYSGKYLYYTMQRHGVDLGLLQTTLEVRNDHLRDSNSIGAWARTLADLIEECFDREDLHRR